MPLWSPAQTASIFWHSKDIPDKGLPAQARALLGKAFGNDMLLRLEDITSGGSLRISKPPQNWRTLHPTLSDGVDRAWGPRSLRRVARRQIREIYGQTKVGRDPRWVRVGRRAALGLAVILPPLLTPHPVVAVIDRYLPGSLEKSSAISVVGSIWAAEVTILALTITLTSVLLSLSSDPRDRTRTLARYRQNALNPMMVFGLTTILSTGAWLVYLGISLTGKTSDNLAAATIEGPFELFAILLLGVFCVGWYVQALIAADPAKKISWLEGEVVEAMSTSLLPVLGKSILTEWALQRGLHVDASCDGDIHENRRDIPELGVVVREYSETTGVLRDVALNRLRSALRANPGSRIIMTAALDRQVRPDIPLAVVFSTNQGAADRFASAFQGTFTYAKGGVSEFEDTLTALRDRAFTAAQAGHVGDFEFVLETVRRLTVTALVLREYRPLRGFIWSPTHALRAALLELGREVLTCTSPNILKAWLQFPQTLCQSARGFPPEGAGTAIVQPWIQAIEMATAPSTSPMRRKVILESLLRRLFYYCQDLQAATRNAPAAAAPRIAKETEDLTAVVSKYIQAASSEHLDGVAHLLLTLDTLSIQPRDRFLWLAYGSRIIDRPADAEGGDRDRWRTVAQKFETIESLRVAWERWTEVEDRALAIDPKFAELEDLSWPEQEMQIRRGLLIQVWPMLHPERPCRDALGFILAMSGGKALQTEGDRAFLSQRVEAAKRHKRAILETCAEGWWNLAQVSAPISLERAIDDRPETRATRPSRSNGSRDDAGVTGARAAARSVLRWLVTHQRLSQHLRVPAEFLESPRVS